MQNVLSLGERSLADNEVELSAFVTVAATVSNKRAEVSALTSKAKPKNR